MNAFSNIIDALKDTSLSPWQNTLPQQLAEAWSPQHHGDLANWLRILESLPTVQPSIVELNADTIKIGQRDDCDAATRVKIETALQQFIPWRKGPFALFDIHIDTEWRSDWKWQRVVPHIQPLAGRTILDVGSGSGYHCLRMVGESAGLVIGLEPMLLYVVQFLALTHFAGKQPAHVLPLPLEAFPDGLPAFDTVFSMGVLYHRRSPFDHLFNLKDCLKSGGELVLETLVIAGNESQVLVPRNRYARMRNVWFIPTCEMLSDWLRRCNFDEIRVVDVTKTTTDEQRSTEWMPFESLPEALSPEDAAITVEGYPAPLRAVFLANKV